MTVTLDNVDAVENAVTDTTDGGPGLSTLSTGRRLSAVATFTYGYGPINAERAVTADETTILDPTVLAGGVVGAAAFAGFAVPADDRQAILRRL